MKSKPLISSWLRGLPTLKVGDCASPAAGAAKITAGTSKLRSEHRIVYAPIASHAPGLHGIEMNGAVGFLRFLAGDAPVTIPLRARRLNFTPFIRAARHEHRLLSFPAPVKLEPRMHLPMPTCL